MGFVRSHRHRRGGSGVLVDDMYDWVHVNEKWFDVMKDGVYLRPAENIPKPPRAQNKRFINKYLFLAAVARPRKIWNGVWFDGKIGIWPIVDMMLSKDSKNCKKGNPIMKPATVNGERYKKLMIEEVISAIKLKEDVDVTNGQELVEELVEATVGAFDVYPREALKRVWQSLSGVYGEVMRCKGDSSYKMPHSVKENLARAGALPKTARVDDGKYSSGMAFWRALGGKD
ncbi:unnamed protein product [Discosporangium mesarthrocarpum]